MNMKEDKKKPAAWPGQLMLILLLPLLIPLLLCIGVAHLVATILIYLAVWLVWNTRGIRLVYVYSNSSHWQEYIEKEILPRFPDGQIVLNWSERQRWKYFSLASVVFHHFGGYRAFNPMAVVLRPFRRAKVFRFYEPFKDFKHGKQDALLKMEKEFFQALGT
jgi:hypothetical protein